MKNLFFSIVLATVIFTPSCKKKEKEQPQPTPCTTSRIVSTVGAGKDSSVYTYSGEKIAAIAVYQSGKILFDSTAYIYSGSAVTIKEYDSSKTEYKTTQVTLGSNGLATKSTSITNTSGITSYDTLTFEYDADGYLIKKVLMANSTRATYTRIITSGNVTKETIITDGSPYSILSTYEYYTDKENKSGLSQDNSFIESFCGKTSKNLIKDNTTNVGSYSTGVTYTYDWDTNGYVSRIRDTSANLGTFVYNKCM